MHKAVSRYTFEGKSLTISEWSKVTGIGTSTLRERIRQYGWTLDRALTEPVRPAPPKRALSPAQTGGYQPTSPLSTGTGVGSRARHLQTKSTVSEVIS